MTKAFLLALLLAAALFAPCAANRKMGGREEVDVNSATVLDIANRIALAVDATTSTPYRQGVVRVVSGVQQVVSGMNYDLLVELGESACLKGGEGVVGDDSPATEPCPPIEGVQTTLRTANVWAQPWLKSYKVTLSD
jgi:hypothetical protein